jgi:galactoside O-acetyltransferase
MGFFYRWRQKLRESRMRKAFLAVNEFNCPGADVRLSFERIHAPASGGCRLLLGNTLILEGSLFYERPGSEIRIGSRTFIGSATKLIAAQSVSIGDDVLISWGVTIVDHDSHSPDFSRRANDVAEWYQGRKDWSSVAIAPVVIGDKAWIGFDAAILKGVRIGEGAVVGAKSVVTKDVAPWSVVAGNPARVIRTLSPQ